MQRISLIKRWIIAVFGISLVLSISIGVLILQPLWVLTTMSPLICPHAGYAVDTPEAVVALTLDDGPDITTSINNSATTQMLDLLAQHQAHATFFLISNKLNHPVGTALAQRIVDEGHELGNHFTEDEHSIQFGDQAFSDRLLQAEQTLSAFATPRWFRPAGGWCSATNAQTLQTYNYETVLGTVWPYDTHIHSVSVAAWQIINTVQPGAIVILHDGGKDEAMSDRGQRTVAILRTVLPALNAEGYQIVSLSELATYGPLITNARALPLWLEPLRRRLVSGWLWQGVSNLPTLQQGGAIALVCLLGAIAMLWLGVQTRFLRYQWASPPPPRPRTPFYFRVIIMSFFLPAMAEEFIFRLLLLPSPAEITGGLTRGQWLECGISIVLYVLAHPFVTGPLRDRLSASRSHHSTRNLNTRLKDNETDRTAYRYTFQQPAFLGLTYILGASCTYLYLQTGSIWPAIIWHWVVVALWLLVLGGNAKLHPN